MITSICISTAYYPPHTGGVEVYTQSIARELVSRGISVVIATSRVDNSPLHEIAHDGVEIFRFPAIDIIGRYPIPQQSEDYARLWAEFDNRAFDAVVVNTRFYQLSMQMLSYARRKGIRPVLIEHGSGYLTLGNPVLDIAVHLYEHATSIYVRHTNPLCYGVSREACEWAGTFGLQSTGTIHNSIDIAAFRNQSSGRDFRCENNIPKDACIVSFTGRIVPEKGIWIVEGAARELEKEGFYFLVAGDGADLKKLRAQKPSNMKCLGRLNRPDIAALLECSDIFCFPSESEGLPTSVLEAAACGAFIVATPVGGMGEIIPKDKYGTVLKDMTPHSCADAIRAAFADPVDMRQRAKLCADHIATEFSWRKTADNLLSACEASASDVNVNGGAC